MTRRFALHEFVEISLALHTRLWYICDLALSQRGERSLDDRFARGITAGGELGLAL
jgi:hypothetical protein